MIAIKTREKIFNDITKEFKNRNIKSIKFLDLGTGIGENVDEIIKFCDLLKIDYEVFCIDINQDFFKHYNKEKIKFLKYNLNEDFYFGQFDLILATEVIEHLENPYKFIKNCLKNLKNNSLLYISSPNVDNIYSLIKILIKNVPIHFQESNFEHLIPIHHFMIKNALKIIEKEEKIKTELKVFYSRGIMKIFFPFKIGEKFFQAISIPLANRFFGEISIYKIRKK